MANLLKPFSRTSDRCFRVFARWLFGGHVTYALLPLLIMAIVARVCPRAEEHFRGLKEWSFAAIIFFGVAIQKFIHLKVRVQQATQSYKLDTGVQVHIVFLIVAVLVLACVVLAERGVFPPTAPPLIEKAQVSMFVVGLINTFIATLAENEPQLFSNRSDKSRASCLERVSQSLGEACEDLDRALYWAEHAGVAKEIPGEDAIGDRRDRQTKANAFDEALQRVQRLADEARRMVPTVARHTHATEDRQPPTP